MSAAFGEGNDKDLGTVRKKNAKLPVRKRMVSASRRRPERGAGDVQTPKEHAEFESIDMSGSHATCENCHSAPAAWFCHHDGEYPFPRRRTFASFSSAELALPSSRKPRFSATRPADLAPLSEIQERTCALRATTAFTTRTR